MSPTVRDFLEACQAPGANCVSAVRECLAHDWRMRAALDWPGEWPEDLEAVARARAAALGIAERWPARGEAAVGFLRLRKGTACCLHIPECGWWAKGTRGAVPIRLGLVKLSYEVEAWHP